MTKHDNNHILRIILDIIIITIAIFIEVINFFSFRNGTMFIELCSSSQLKVNKKRKLEVLIYGPTLLCERKYMYIYIYIYVTSFMS